MTTNTTTGAEAIAEERVRQITELGYTTVHDEQHQVMDLVGCLRRRCRPSTATPPAPPRDARAYTVRPVWPARLPHLRHP